MPGLSRSQLQDPKLWESISQILAGILKLLIVSQFLTSVAGTCT